MFLLSNLSKSLDLWKYSAGLKLLSLLNLLEDQLILFVSESRQLDSTGMMKHPTVDKRHDKKAHAGESPTVFVLQLVTFLIITQNINSKR